MNSKKNGTKAHITLVSVCIAICMMITACGSYKPPYQRGYDEGYSAGYSDGSSIASVSGNRDMTAADNNDPAGQGTSDEQGKTAGDDDSDKAKKSGILTFLSGSSDDGTDKNEADEAETSKEDTSADDVTGAAEDMPVTDDGVSAEVLAQTDVPTESGDTKSWGGRVIRAEAVNEAMYSNPEVIEGLRQIYDDSRIFGEFVGDSGTNKLHKVGGSHFSSLTFEELVVFDETKSVDDILNEGFYANCECMGE